MGYINQALVQDRLFVGAERIPVVLLATLCALGIVIDMDIGGREVLISGAIFSWGFWVLRSCAEYDPRLFQNLVVKLGAYVPLWLVRTARMGRWSIPASPSYLRQGPYLLRGRETPDVEGAHE